MDKNAIDIWMKEIWYILLVKIILFSMNQTTALDINGTKMNALYLKQKDLYDSYKISNYIFAKMKI